MSSFRTVRISDHKFETNGLRILTVKSANLQGRGDIFLFVPKVKKGVTNLPIYILLHGVYGSAWSWAMQGGAAYTAQILMSQQQIRPAIIAMPSDGLWGDGSAYTAHHGKKFDDWIVKDVPLVIKENITEAGTNSPLCIGGLSMGGYGALLLGARYPDTFKAISGHSSITKLEEMQQFVEEPIEDLIAEVSLPNVIDAIKKNQSQLPAVRFDCGRTDILIEGNRLLHQQLTDLKIKHTYQEFEGSHEWPYWQRHVEKTFRFFDKIVFT